MEKIKKLEKTIDIDALVRWVLRKWKSGLLLFCVVAIAGGVLKVIIDNALTDQGVEEVIILEEEEMDAIEEYLEYDIYIEKVQDIIGILEEEIQEDLSTIDDGKITDESMAALSNKMELLETYKSYYSSIVGAQNGLKSNFSDAQNAYFQELERDETEETGEEIVDSNKRDDVIKEIKGGIKIGVLFGILAVCIWGFGLIFIFSVTKKIKSKEDVLAICGDMPVVEGKRSFMKSGKVQIGENLGIGEFLEDNEIGIVNLAGEMIFDVDSWNEALKKNEESAGNKVPKIVLITEIGVSSYEDVIRAEKRFGGRLAGCLMIS